MSGKHISSVWTWIPGAETTLSQDIINKVVTTIQKYTMLSGEEKILIGISGGPDSVCLTNVLHLLKERYKTELHALYVDHSLRPQETPEEILLCKSICEQYGIPLRVKVVDVQNCVNEEKLNKQEAARKLRYAAYEETAFDLKADRIALGHTADDQAETFLMRLLRGAGTTGLAGIPPTRNMIIRPLIECEKQEVESYLKSLKVDFAVDSSNLSADYTRNSIRMKLIPLLHSFNPDIIQTLCTTAEILRDEERYFEILVTKTLMKMISRKTDQRIELFATPFDAMDNVLIRRVLRRAIDETKGLKGIGFAHIEDIIRLIKNGNPGDRIYLPKGIRVIKEYSTLVLTSDPPVKMKTYNLSVPGKTILKEAGLVITASEIMKRKPEHDIQTDTARSSKTFALIDAEKVQFPLTARRREDGDFFFPAGFGKRKKLQDFFVDEKVPRDERDRIPLITSGNDIIWVVGYRGDDRFMVTDSTKTVLRLEIGKLRD